MDSIVIDLWKKWKQQEERMNILKAILSKQLFNSIKLLHLGRKVKLPMAEFIAVDIPEKYVDLKKFDVCSKDLHIRKREIIATIEEINRVDELMRRIVDDIMDTDEYKKKYGL